MPCCKVNLSPDLDEFVQTNIECGSYSNVTELVEAALHALDREKRINDAKRSTSPEAADGSSNDIRKTDVFRKLWELQLQSSPEASGSGLDGPESCQARQI